MVLLQLSLSVMVGNLTGVSHCFWSFFNMLSHDGFRFQQRSQQKKKSFDPTVETPWKSWSNYELVQWQLNHEL